MLLNLKPSYPLSITLLNQSSIEIMLTIVVVFFGIILLLGVRKSYILKKENEQINAINESISDDTDKPYQDFTEGHMYGGN